LAVLDNLKDSSCGAAVHFSERGRAYGLPHPRGFDVGRIQEQENLSCEKSLTTGTTPAPWTVIWWLGR